MQRWEPFREMERVSDMMDRLFEGGAWRPRHLLRPFFGEGELALDVYRTPEALIVKGALPGVKPEEVRITIEGNTLIVIGEHKEEQEGREKDYLLKERRYGSFTRTITLPTGLDTDKAEATYASGVLTLTIPRVEKEKPKSVDVKVKAA